jgi:GNAT superfamily N-acetyltransferase
MTDRTWHLWWIAVRRDHQSRGLGARLLAACEDGVRAAGGRLLLIETSSLAGYAPTHRFYAKHGYQPPARIPDFYADGDDLLVFPKRLR